MKQGAFLINTGRGSLVDTDALIVALEDGKLGGAALDVLEGEEGLFYFDCTNRPIDNRLLLALQRLPNVIITPHTAYYTRRALYDTVEQTLIKCRNFERSRATHDETAESRDPVRGLLGGTRRVGEVRDGGRGEHRHAEVRADLHRHHQDAASGRCASGRTRHGTTARADEP